MIPGVEAFILAGGHSRRMKRPKALLEIGGRANIVRVADVLREVCVSVRVVTDRPEEVAFLGVPVLPDVYPEKGPLGGLHAALSATNEPAILLSAADLPFLSAPFVTKLSSFRTDIDITLPATSEGMHPLCAFYVSTLSEKTRLAIEADQLSMRRFVVKNRYRAVTAGELPGIDLGRELFNTNTPEELAVARQMAADTAGGSRSHG